MTDKFREGLFDLGGQPMTMSSEEIRQPAHAVGDAYAETLRELLETHTPAELEVLGVPDGIWPGMTAEEMIAQGRHETFVNEHAVLTRMLDGYGALDAEGLLRDLRHVTEKPLACAVALLLQASGARWKTEGLADLQEILDALIGMYGIERVREQVEQGD